MLHPIQVDGIIRVPSVGTSEMPPRCRMSRPITPMRGCWPNHERVETSAIPRDTLDRRYKGALRAGTSVVPQLIITHKDLQRFRLTQKYSRLVHVIDILG